MRTNRCLRLLICIILHYLAINFIMVRQQISHFGALGVNYNESLSWINHDELRRAGTTWVRGFLDMHQVKDDAPIEDDHNLRALMDAKKAGFKVILSLKWNYGKLDFPGSDSDAQAAELHRLKRLLPVVMGKVDILVVGNEPFLECQPGHGDDRLNEFYELLVETVIEYRRTAGGDAASTRLFLGALVRIDMHKRSPATERVFSFIRMKKELDGVDLHMHVPRKEVSKEILDWGLQRIRADQTFLVTEFSLIWHWKAHMEDVASSAYLKKYGFPEGTTTGAVINEAIKKPVPWAQWEDFLRNEPWYMNRKHFLSNVMKMYRDTGRLEVATYSFSPMRHRKHPLRSTENPWFLNGLIAPPTVQLQEDGMKYENWPWAEEFRRLQVNN